MNLRDNFVNLTHFMFKKRELDQLAGEFDKLRISQSASAKAEQSGDSESSENEDLRELRSGTRHRRLPKETSITNTMSTTPPNTANAPAGAGAGPQLSQGVPQIPLKVLSTTIDVPSFSGVATGQTARKFIVRCENVMTHSLITAPEDKISFVLSKLEMGSLAHNMMDSSVFLEPIEEKDYDAFRLRFLETFDDCGRGHVIQGLNAICDRLIKSTATKGRLEAQVEASQTVGELIRIQGEGGWSNNSNITGENQRRFLEIFTYLLVLKDRERKATFALDFKPGEDLHVFSKRLQTRLKEGCATSSLYAAAAVADSQSASLGQDSVKESYAAAVKDSSVVLTCHYCSKPGHTANRCFAKQKDKKKLKKTPQPGVPPKFASDAAVRPKRPTVAEQITRSSHTPRTAPTSTAVSGKYCSVHNTNSHSLQECYAVESLRQRVQTQQRGSGALGGNHSGEASRPAQTRPG